MEPRSTRDIEMLFKLIVKVPVVGNTADTPNPPGLLPFKRKFGSPHGPKKIWPQWVQTPLVPNFLWSVGTPKFPLKG